MPSMGFSHRRSLPGPFAYRAVPKVLGPFEPGYFSGDDREGRRFGTTMAATLTMTENPQAGGGETLHFVKGNNYKTLLPPKLPTFPP